MRDYSLEVAKDVARRVVMTCAPRTIRDVLDTMLMLGYRSEDLNRRAVLYLLDEGKIVIERAQRRIRVADPSGGSYEAFLKGM